jgi:hypothetical protein
LVGGGRGMGGGGGRTGQGEKDPRFYGTFSKLTKIIEKTLFYEGEIRFLERGLGIFLNFFTI